MKSPIPGNYPDKRSFISKTLCFEDNHKKYLGPRRPSPEDRLHFRGKRKSRRHGLPKRDISDASEGPSNRVDTENG